MIIYGDILLLENMITGGVLLYITAQIYGVEFVHIKERLRLAAGSLMCGVFSLTVFLQAGAAMLIVMEGAFAFAVCFAVFGKHRLWQKSVAFILVTYFMGGMIMGLLYITRRPGIYTAAGIYTGDMKAGMLAVFLLLFFITARQVVRTVRNKKFCSAHIFEAVIESGELKISIKAFLDTGNQLRDPVSGRPVAVADEKLWQKLQECGMIREEKFCMIPYESVGGKGLLEAVKVDSITLNECGADVLVGGKDARALKLTGRIVSNCVIARNDGMFLLHGDDAKECGLLLSKHMADKGM